MKHFLLYLIVLAALVFAPASFTATIHCNTGGTTWCNGTNNQDKMTSDSRGQLLNGFAGPDEMLGNDGDDLLVGQKGIDWIEGNQGPDDLYGGISADTIMAGYAKDWINTGCRSGSVWNGYCLSGSQVGEAAGWYHGGPDRDVVISVNGKYDSGTCGPGYDRAYVDFSDTLGTLSFLDCEEVVCACGFASRPGDENPYADRGVASFFSVVSEEDGIAMVEAWRAEWELSNEIPARPVGEDG